jgi:hypothetical protein
MLKTSGVLRYYWSLRRESATQSAKEKEFAELLAELIEAYLDEHYLTRAAS